MTDYDSIDYLISISNNQKNAPFLDQSFDFEMNESYKENNNNKTQLNNIFLTPYNSEKLDSPNIDIVQLNPNSIIIDIPQNLPINSEHQQQSKKYKYLGRKKKNSGEKGAHNKYSEDNIIRKIKSYLYNGLRNLINLKIKEYLDLTKITFNGIKISKIEIVKIRQNQVVDLDVENNKKLLDTKIKDFFNDETSGNFSSYPKNFNHLLIQKLYEIDKGKKVIGIFEKTFLDCLKYFRMDKDILEDPNYFCLKGLENSFSELKNKILEDNDESYNEKLFQSIKNFESIILNRTKRRKRKNLI